MDAKQHKKAFSKLCASVARLQHITSIPWSDPPAGRYFQFKKLLIFPNRFCSIWQKWDEPRRDHLIQMQGTFESNDPYAMTMYSSHNFDLCSETSFIHVMMTVGSGTSAQSVPRLWKSQDL